MALETQVGQLVTATTALQATVSSELTKVRAENETFKSGLATKVGTERLEVARSGYSPVVLKNTSKFGASIVRDYALFNFKAGEVGGPAWDGFAIYSYKFASPTSLSPTEVRIPFTIFDNQSFALGGFQPAPMEYRSYAIGEAALSSSLQFINTVGLGAGANVTGDNQVQLGSPFVTVFSQNAIQLRSDVRDKADIQPTTLGLKFIKALKPVDYRWDIRESYRTAMPSPPMPLSGEASEDEKTAYESTFATYKVALADWQEANKLENLKPDGSKKRKRIHHGLIAQDVKELIQLTGQDFGGFQDHKMSGGQDVLSVGYTELIGPLIKAVQELAQANEKLAQMNEELRARISTLESTKA